jgi:hypothetical protein
MAKPECYTQDHGLLYLTSGTMKNVERLVSLKNEFRNIKTRLMKAIEERKKIRIHNTELLDAIESIERDVQSKLDENEKQLGRRCRRIISWLSSNARGLLCPTTPNLTHDRSMQTISSSSSRPWVLPARRE